MSSSTACENPETLSVELERTLIKATLSLEGKTLKISQELRLTQPVEEIFLNIPANIFASSTIYNISPMCENIKLLNDNVAIQLSFFEKTTSIILDYEIYLRSETSILSHRDNKVILSEFLITPAPVIEGLPLLSVRSEFGDPFVYDMQDYEVTITVDSEYTIFAPGKVFEYSDAGCTTASCSAKHVRDFPIVLIKSPRVANGNYRDIKITYVNMPDVHITVNHAFEFIEQITEFDYPYEEMLVIGADIDLSGMEYSQMIIISEDLADKPVELKKIITHEIFHQWFYGIVGTNQIEEPYIDEGIVCYLTNRALGKTINLNTKRDKYSLGINAFSTKTEYYKQVYSGGCAYFAELSEALGSQFNTLLKGIFEKYSGEILKSSDLSKEIEMLK